MSHPHLLMNHFYRMARSVFRAFQFQNTNEPGVSFSNWLDISLQNVGFSFSISGRTKDRMSNSRKSWLSIGLDLFILNFRSSVIKSKSIKKARKYLRLLLITQVDDYGIRIPPYTTVFCRITWSRITIVDLRTRIRSNTIIYGEKRRPYMASVY